MKKKEGNKSSGTKQLSLKERRFVEAMADLRTRSQTEAAIKAGYSPKTARIIASQNLTKLYIIEAIERRKQRALTHARVSLQEVLGAAVFQMRSSMDDLLDDNGSFSLEKARMTGAVDLIKKHKETIKRIVSENGTQETRTIEVEILNNQDAREEVAGYMKLSKETFPTPPADPSDEELARELYYRLIQNRGWTPDAALEGIKHRFPAIDIKLLTDVFP